MSRAGFIAYVDNLKRHPVEPADNDNLVRSSWLPSVQQPKTRVGGSLASVRVGPIIRVEV